MRILGKDKNSQKLMIVLILLTINVSSIILRRDLITPIYFLLISGIFSIYIFVNTERLIYFSIIVSLLSNFLSQYSGAFSNIPQIVLILLSLKILFYFSITKEKIKYDKFITIITILTIVFNTISYIFFINYKGGIVLYLWAMLKRYSFFIIFIYIYNTNKKTIILNKLKITFNFIIVIQFFLTLIQFKTGVNYDNVTGLFGLYSTGEYAHFLLVILSIYMSDKNKNSKDKYFMIFLIIHILIYSIIAEVKLLFFAMPILIFLDAIIERKFKNIIIIISTFFILVIGANIYTIIYPEKTFFEKDLVKKYLTEDYGEVGLNRFNFMEQLNQNIFENDMQSIIGMGIGAAHPSSKSELLQGPVYKENKDLKIDWFSLPYLITESGILGTILYLSIYAYLLIKYGFIAIKTKEKTIFFIAVLSIISIIYNSSLVGSIRMIIFTWTFISLFYNHTKNIIRRY